MFVIVASVFLTLLLNVETTKVKDAGTTGKFISWKSEASAIRFQMNLSNLVPQACQAGWVCAHSPGRGSCFVTTATYIGKVALSCLGCKVTQPTGSQNIQTPSNPSLCPNCVPTILKAPKCGGTFLGIGSGRMGRSCKLIDGTGCFPLRTAPVLHDCGAGAECRFKVSEAKAKVWCCRPKKKCKFFQVACKVTNLFRCSSSALSKSKDKDGAQVLWEE